MADQDYGAPVIQKNEAVAELSRRLQDPAYADDHERIRAALVRRQQRAETVSETGGRAAANTAAGPGSMSRGLPDTELQTDKTLQRPANRAVRLLGRASDVGSQAAVLAANKATGELHGALEDSLAKVSRGEIRMPDFMWRAREFLGDHGVSMPIGYTRDQERQFRAEHPVIAPVADAVGYVAPVGAPAMESQIARKLTDPLLRAVMKRQAGFLPGQIVGRALGGAAQGGITGAEIGATETAARGASPTEVGEAALRSAKSGAMFGAGFGAVSAAGGSLASRIRRSNPDIEILDKHGLEPGPIPGRPVIRQNKGVLSQLPGVTEPPITSQAGPGTRAAAARAAADVIVPDAAERFRVNNERFGEMQQQAYLRQGTNHVPMDRMLNHIDAELSVPGVQQSPTGAALANLKDAIEKNSYKTPIGRIMLAQDLDKIRDMADKLGRRQVQVEKVAQGDVPFRKFSDMARSSLTAIAPEIARLNKLQHEVLSGMEARNELMGKRSANRLDNEQTRSAAAERFAQSGEDAKVAGKGTGESASAPGVRGSRAERLAELGPAPMLPGANTGKAMPMYGALLDRPRLHLAQENLQFNPSRLFSAAGPRTLMQAPATLAKRGLYPAARRLGDAEVGAKGPAADALTGALRRRRKKQTEGAE